ncbi:glycosyltransferase family 2 protein [Pontiellaceae bacterium B12219]|nr:glycosyltransferase family 2 protein [Pontiellaceae bacterium B12219]
MPPSVAIIIRAKDEMPYVQQALAHLQSQTFSPFDLFFVDSGSADGTLQTLEKAGGNLVQIPPEAYVPGKVLNEAISRTRHEIIVLLNADAIPQSNDWLEQLLLPILGNSAEATFSKQIPRPDAKFIVKYDYERAYNPEKIEPGFFSAVACAFKRSLWEKQHFPNEGYAEDVAWARQCVANGARFQLLEKSVVEHSHNYSLKGLFRKRYRQALTFSDVPASGKLVAKCMREIIRDVLYACSRLQLQTIPYNIIYRITIYRGMQRGFKDQ